MKPLTGKRLIAWRIALAGWLVGWFINTSENVGLFVSAWERPILEHPLFPGVMCDGRVALLLFALPLAGFAGFSGGTVFRLRVVSGILALVSLGLLGHLCTYNDATYTTTFWSALWMGWWAGRIEGSGAGAERHAIALGQGLVGLCFLGGFVGKLTPEYWSGEVFHGIYVLQKPYFPFSWMRDNWPEAASKTASAWMGRGMIVTEGVLSTLVFWPTRAALGATLGVFVVMTLLAQVQILSVLAPLAGVMVACGFLGETLEPEDILRDAAEG
ncbi:MAG: hypothetical protein KGS60_06185 [Verrucomicrobia bacterium]|nr:hypothetical protein [Verrucomicrobiota bacterium]